MAFKADFYFLQDQVNFWQTDLFWPEKHRCAIGFVDNFCTLFLRSTYAKNSVFQGYLLEIFCGTKNKRNRCFVKWRSHQNLAFAAIFLFIQLRHPLTVASLAYANKALNWSDSSLFCLDTGWIQGWSISFPLYFLTKIQTSILKNSSAVEAVKSKCLSSYHVKIHLQSFFAPKDGAWKTEFFLHTLFLENEAQINKTNKANILFMSKQISLPKIDSILKKMKVSPKCYIRPIYTKAFNCSWIHIS